MKTFKEFAALKESTVGFGMNDPRLNPQVQSILKRIEKAPTDSTFQVSWMTRPEFIAAMETITDSSMDYHYYVGYDPQKMTVSVGNPGDV